MLLNDIHSMLSKQQKRKMIVLVVLMIVSALLEVCGISSVLPVVYALLEKDFMYTNEYAAQLCSLLGIGTYQSFVFACICILLVVFIVKNVILLIKNDYYAKFTQNFQYSLREQMFHKYLAKDYSFYFANNSSDICKTLIADIANTSDAFASMLTILTDSIVSLFLVVAVIVIDWRISLAMILVMLLVSLGISRLIRPAINKSGGISFTASMVRNKLILQALQGIKTVMATEKASYFENKVHQVDLDFSNAEKTHTVLVRVPRMIMELFAITSFVILIAVIVLGGDDFASLIPSLSVIGLAFIKLIPGANSIISNVASVRYRAPSIRETAKLMQEDIVDDKGADEKFPDRYSCSIQASDIYFRYSESGDYILNGATLSIPIGDMVGIVGVSGEGKTTFVDILLGLLSAESGSVCADGADIRTNLRKWHESIGYITQDVFLLDTSIRENVAFGIDSDDVSDDQVWKSLEKAQLADFVRSLPEGIDTTIGERGVKLSGGQRQRIGIARALYGDPQILIFDEATSSLDSDTERGVVDAINELYGAHTILVVAHRSVALERCDRIYRIEHGVFVLAD